MTLPIVWDEATLAALLDDPRGACYAWRQRVWPRLFDPPVPWPPSPKWRPPSEEATREALAALAAACRRAGRSPPPFTRDVLAAEIAEPTLRRFLTAVRRAEVAAARPRAHYAPVARWAEDAPLLPPSAGAGPDPASQVDWLVTRLRALLADGWDRAVAAANGRWRLRDHLAQGHVPHLRRWREVFLRVFEPPSLEADRLPTLAAALARLRAPSGDELPDLAVALCRLSEAREGPPGHQPTPSSESPGEIIPASPAPRKRARSAPTPDGPPPLEPHVTLRARLSAYGRLTRDLDVVLARDSDGGAARLDVALDGRPRPAVDWWRGALLVALLPDQDPPGDWTSVFALLWEDLRPPLHRLVESMAAAVQAAVWQERPDASVRRCALRWPASVTGGVQEVYFWPRDHGPRLRVALRRAVARWTDWAQPAALLCVGPRPAAPALDPLRDHVARCLDAGRCGAAPGDQALPGEWSVAWAPCVGRHVLHRRRSPWDDDAHADPEGWAGAPRDWPVLPRARRNVPTAEEARRCPTLAAVREVALARDWAPDLARDVLWRLDLGRLLNEDAVGDAGPATPPSDRAVERTLVLLAYWLASPAQQPPDLFAAAQEAAELPVGARDRSLDPRCLCW